MASSKSKAWGPTHPSAAFLIKCAKEKEKLRSTLQGQLQEHMLQMLQNNVFSDTLIGINTSLKETPSENKNKHPDLPKLFNAHKAILKVRTPAFYNNLNEHEETNLGVTSYNAYLQESELLQFLKKVYTDDDIRKHECEALHLSKKYIELVRHNKGPLNKHIFEVDEFEKESANSSCTESFVTPKTSPISPDSKADVVGIFGAANNQVNMRKNKVNSAMTSPSKAYRLKGSINNELHIDLSLDKDFPESDGEVKSSEASQQFQNGRLSSDDSHSSTPNQEGTNSDPDSELGEVSNLGSMVRSNTFDLETQGSLEDAAIDDSIEWCYRPSNEASKNSNIDQEKLKLPCKRNESTGFYLHDHTPSPKSNIFKSPFHKESSFSSSQELDSASSGLHFRRFDGSMSDSGFMSHSTFSLLSDTGISNSVASSLIMSSDGISASPMVSVGPEMNPPLSEHNKQLSGSMFPFYIDINNLPPPSPNSAKSKKSSPGHTYMYIDARNQKVSVGPNPEPAYQKTTYDEFFAGLQSKDEFGMKEPLMKAQSTSQLDRCSNGDGKLNFAKDRHRPQSCYMYVDLESVKQEPVQSRKSSIHEPTSVSMYINLKDDPKENNGIDEETYSRISSGSQLSGSFSGYSDLQSSNGGFVVEQRRKLSDSFLSSSPTPYESRTKFFSLSRHQESRSVTSLDNHLPNNQEVFHLLHSTGPRKSRSAHRYSEGVYYDNLYHRKFSSNNLCQPTDKRVSKDSKTYQGKDIKAFDETYRLMQFLSKNEETSGSCSNLGKMGLPDRLLSDEKVRWKSTGEIEKPKVMNSKEESGLLPMSPILRRKKQVKETPEVTTPPVVIKASTKPQDVDAMKFPKTLIENAQPPDKPLGESPKDDELQVQSSAKKLEKHDSKSSSDSLKLGSDGPPESNEIKLKTLDSMSRSGSSQMTVSGGESTSDKHTNHDVKDKISPPLLMSVSCEFEDDTETIYSEVSDVSSSLGGVSGVASLERRWRESQNQQSEFTNKNLKNTRHMLEACSKLGEDLLKMFLDEIDTDITIEVEGKQIRAHRCILASRGKYFANLLRANNPEKNTSTISLEGFTYPAVHFALCHIYSGAMSIPKDCNISELALLADMLNLETLTDVIVFHLKMHYCHFFHRPCLQCSQGVVECLPLAVVCGLNDLRDKCIYWLGRNFTRTWPNKAFAALSEELRDLCFNVTVGILAINTVIDMTLNCDRLLTTLPQLKWTEPIFGMITKLLQKCIHYMAKNFDEILNSEGFLALGKGQSWNVTALEEDIISSIELMSPDVACKSYDIVNRLILVAESMESTGYGEFTQNFIDLLHKISRHSERYLIQNANKVVHCESWACLSPQVQKRIKDAAVIVFEFEKPTAPPPRLSSLHRKLKKQNESEEINFERSTYPKKGRPGHNRKYQRDFSPKSVNSQVSQDSPERSIQRRDHESLIKKIVSPIKEEAQYSSVDNSAQDVSYDPDPVIMYGSPARSHLSNKAYIDAHEEDSLRDLQDLPQDHTNQGEPGSESQMLCSVASLDLDDSRSPAHCSDNPDSLEANEEISSDSKEDVDLSASNEDGSNPEKGVNEKPEVLDKIFELSDSPHIKELSNNSSNQNKTSTPKPSLNIPVRDKAPSLLPTVPPPKDGQSKIREKSPIKKAHGKSLLPLAKTHVLEESKLPISPELKSKDLVAEIDADSRMVNHCLQEAEMLEQQLSRKLQRQHLDGSSNQNSPARTRASAENKSAKSYGTRLQKASSTSQIKSLANGPSRGRSPGRSTKSNASSPLVGNPPRIGKFNDSAREKGVSRKASHSPKNGVPPSNGPFRSMESIASVHKQLSVVSQTPKRVVTRSSRTKVISMASVRTAVGPK